MLLRVIIICIIFYCIFLHSPKEHFMSYDQKRDYYFCKYGGNPYSRNCRKFFYRINNLKKYIINNPVGYVYKKRDGVTVERLPLSAWYDRDTRKWYYYVIDYVGKSGDKRRPRNIFIDSIIHAIGYKGRELFDGDAINVPGHGRMLIKLYWDKDDPSTTILNDAMYMPSKHPHFEPSPRWIDIPSYKSKWRTVGYIFNKGEFYKLFEKEYPTDNYRYRVQLYPGVFLNVKKDDKYRFKDNLMDGDRVMVDSIEEQGEFLVKIYKYDDIAIDSHDEFY